MKHIFLTTILLWIFSPPFLSAKVWINELMQSNIDIVRVGNEFPDSWIELYNDADYAVNIQNWIISDKNDYLKGWKITIPANIPAKSFLLIYADRNATGLHTDFRLDSGNGGSVYLFDASGTLIDYIKNIAKQKAPNISFGRTSDGGEDWAYFVTATPGASNTGKTSMAVLPPPIFSHSGGIFKNGVTLSLSLPAGVPGEASIHYTLDNTEPTLSSPVYTSEINISKSTVIRAKLLHPEYLTNIATVHSYIIETERKLGLPVVSISIDPEYWDGRQDVLSIIAGGKEPAFWDAGFGIYRPKNGDPLRSNKWWRPVNFEYFPSDNATSALNQLCNMRIGGGGSRVYWQRTLIINTNKRFGVNRFNYDFFPEKLSDEKPFQEIKSFMLRNSGNDHEFTFFRDVAVQQFFGGKVDVDYQAYQPAMIYINGNYYGIQNMRERANDDYVLSNYGLDNTEVDVITNWQRGANNLKAGDFIEFDRLIAELDKPLAQRDYEWIMNKVDIDEFINYIILEIYVANRDFPHNNVVMWRPRTPDGKWRFILKDLDVSLSLFTSGNWFTPVTWDALTYNISGGGGQQYEAHARKLFSALMQHEATRKKFYGRFAVYMGVLLHNNATTHIMDSIQNMIYPYYQDHLNLWRPCRQYPITYEWWQNEVNRMKDWCMNRNTPVYGHLRSYFQLGPIMKLTYEKSNDLKGTPAVFINGVRMRSSGLNGSYFQNEFIELQYSGNTTHPHYGWEITKTVEGATSVDTTFQYNFSCKIAEGCTFVKIKLVNNPKPEIVDPPTGVRQPENVSQVLNTRVYDNQLEISDLLPNAVISIYDLSGKLIIRTSTSNNSIIIPLHQKGIFIVTVQNKTQMITQKIVNL